MGIPVLMLSLILTLTLTLTPFSLPLWGDEGEGVRVTGKGG
jgi:hypothetical protein